MADVTDDGATKTNPDAAPGVEDPKVEDPKVEDPKVEDPKVEDPAKGTAPVAYDLTMPKDSLLNPDVKDEILAHAKQEGLSNDAAQALLDREHKAVEKYNKAQLEEFETTRNVWVDEIKADKEIGGDKFNESVEMSRRVIERFGTEDFKSVLEETGWGNNPEVVRIFSRIGASMSEDQFVMPGSQSATGEKTQKDSLKKIYDHPTSQPDKKE